MGMLAKCLKHSIWYASKVLNGTRHRAKLGGRRYIVGVGGYILCKGFITVWFIRLITQFCRRADGEMCRYIDVEMSRYGDLEKCRCGDVETW